MMVATGIVGGLGKGQACSQETTAYSDSTTVLTRGRTRRTFLNPTRQLEDGDHPCGIFVSSCPYACVSGQVMVRWIHHSTATLRCSTKEAVGGYMEQRSTVRNIPRVSPWLSIPPLWFVFEGIRVPYHAWQPTQRSPRRRKYQIIPRLSVQSYEPPRSALPGTLSSRLYWTGRYDG